MTEARIGRNRPLSPHLQVWRWHITMAASILTRATGVSAYVGMLLLAVWAVCLASGPSAYTTCMALFGSPLGLLVLFGLTLANAYHLAAGVRHLVFDSGKGFRPHAADASAWAAIAFALVASVLLFIVALGSR